jgi:hypothetical protein
VLVQEMLLKIFISTSNIDFAENTGYNSGGPKRRYQAGYFSLIRNTCISYVDVFL